MSSGFRSRLADAKRRRALCDVDYDDDDEDDDDNDDEHDDDEEPSMSKPWCAHEFAGLCHIFSGQSHAKELYLDGCGFWKIHHIANANHSVDLQHSFTTRGICVRYCMHCKSHTFE